MRKLNIQYVQRLPRQPDDLPQDVVEVYIHVTTHRVDLCIARRDFIASHRAIESIADRVKQLVVAIAGNHRPVAERIGLAPVLSADWYQFLDNLFQQADSWSFLACTPVVPMPC